MCFFKFQPKRIKRGKKAIWVQNTTFMFIWWLYSSLFLFDRASRFDKSEKKIELNWIKSTKTLIDRTYYLSSSCDNQCACLSVGFSFDWFLRFCCPRHSIDFGNSFSFLDFKPRTVEETETIESVPHTHSPEFPDFFFFFFSLLYLRSTTVLFYKCVFWLIDLHRFCFFIIIPIKSLLEEKPVLFISLNIDSLLCLFDDSIRI